MSEKYATSPIETLDGLLSRTNLTSEKIRKGLSTWTYAMGTYALVRQVRQQVTELLAYTVSIDSGDVIYGEVHMRLLSMIPQKKRRSLVIAGRREFDMSTDTIGNDAKTMLYQYYDGHREQRLTLDGCRVKVLIERDDFSHLKREDNKAFLRQERIIFTAYSARGRDAIMAFIQQIVDESNKTEAPRFMMSERWGGWRRRFDLEPRALDTVVLRPGQKEALVDDMQDFLTLRAQYMKFGIPYHRGYMFYGPPGTGKTSLAKALATHFGLNIYYIPLSDLEKDTSLLTLVAGVEPGSVLLLEDIDVLHAAKSRDDDDQGVTLSGLLNALDGVSTPSGLITIMTTNYRDVLDDALIRPGRIDRMEEITFMDDAQLAELAHKFLGVTDPLPPLEKDVSPADVLEVVKRHLSEPEEAVEALVEFIEAPVPAAARPAREGIPTRSEVRLPKSKKKKNKATVE